MSGSFFLFYRPASLLPCPLLRHMVTQNWQAAILITYREELVFLNLSFKVSGEMHLMVHSWLTFLSYPIHYVQRNGVTWLLSVCRHPPSEWEQLSGQGQSVLGLDRHFRGFPQHRFSASSRLQTMFHWCFCH